MNFLMMDPKKLVHYERNSKRHPPEQIEAIAKSIISFGFDQPVVVDSKMVIIKGHGRTLASISLGLKEIPVLVRDTVTETDAKFLREIDNHLNTTEWDKENLATELLDLKSKGALDLSLFTEKMIPSLPQLNITVSQEEFDVNTKHECAECHYKW